MYYYILILHIMYIVSYEQSPIIVVDELVNAITDKRPSMWYFPGYQSQILR